MPAVKVIIDRVNKSLQSIELDQGKSKVDGANYFGALRFNRIPSLVSVNRIKCLVELFLLYFMCLAELFLRRQQCI